MKDIAHPLPVSLSPTALLVKKQDWVLRVSFMVWFKILRLIRLHYTAMVRNNYHPENLPLVIFSQCAVSNNKDLLCCLTL